MLKVAILLGLLAMASVEMSKAGDIKLELCAFTYDFPETPYGGRPKFVDPYKCYGRRPVMHLLYERYGRGDRVNFWVPYADGYDAEKYFFKGPRAYLKVDEDTGKVKEVHLKGDLKIHKKSKEYNKYKEDIVYMDIKSYDMVDYTKCACPKQYKFIDSLHRSEPKCDFDEYTEGYNCPKCECGACRNENYKHWSYFKKTEGYIDNLKGNKCEVVAKEGNKLGVLAQAGPLGANAKNDKFGYSFWAHCAGEKKGEEDHVVDEHYEYSDFDFNIEFGLCQHECLPEDPSDLLDKFQALEKKIAYKKVPKSLLQEQIASKLRANLEDN